MEASGNVLLRFDSWSRPVRTQALKETDILRSISFDAHNETQRELQAETTPAHMSQPLLEAKATLSTTQRSKDGVEPAKQKPVVQIDVHCTPGSSFEDIIKHLESPALPTVKLTGLTSSLQEDLQRFANSTWSACSFETVDTPSLEEELAKFPAGQTFQATISTTSNLHHAMTRHQSSDGPLTTHFIGVGHWTCVPNDRGEVPTQQISILPEDSLQSSLERPQKRQRQSSRDEMLAGESSSDTGSAALNHCRTRRLACLKCGTHQTPQWRMGPDGPRTMCNACGVKYKKELREKGKRDKERRPKQHSTASDTDAISSQQSP